MASPQLRKETLSTTVYQMAARFYFSRRSFQGLAQLAPGLPVHLSPSISRCASPAPVPQAPCPSQGLCISFFLLRIFLQHLIKAGSFLLIFHFKWGFLRKTFLDSILYSCFYSKLFSFTVLCFIFLTDYLIVSKMISFLCVLFPYLLSVLNLWEQALLCFISTSLLSRKGPGLCLLLSKHMWKNE